MKCHSAFYACNAAKRLFALIAICCIGFPLLAEPEDEQPAKVSKLLAVDLSASGLEPITWASDSPTLAHYGLSASAGLEYETPISVPLRLELGYVGVTSSAVASNGELYRGWSGMRIAFLSGYSFKPISIGGLGSIKISALVGAAVTAASYNDTALAYVYPSVIVEPRAMLLLNAIKASESGPYIAIPVELEFRSGNYTLAPGLCLGFRYALI
jgi:hypothetical protein